MDIDDLFSSPRNLLASAYDHIDEFGIGLRRAVHDNKSEIVVDIEPETGDQIHWMRFEIAIHPRLQVAAFNAATELRASLDHSVYAATLALGKRSAPTKTAFAFGDDITKFEGELERRCGHVPTEIKAVLHGLQPYPGGDETLWRLNKLRNVKDHRTLLMPDAKVQTANMKGRFTVTPDYVGPIPPVVVWKPGGLPARENQIPLLRVPHGVIAKYDADTSIDILFGSPKEVRGMCVTDFFVDAHRAVRRAVALMKFEVIKVLAARGS